MRIEEIDKNFAVKTFDNGEEKKVYKIPCKPFEMHGLYYDEKAQLFVRMDLDLANSISDKLGALVTNTAGGRIRFRTDAKIFTITVKYPRISKHSIMTLAGRCGFTLVAKHGKREEIIGILSPENDDQLVYTGSCEMYGEMKDYILYFPMYNAVSSVEIALDKNAKVEQGSKYKDILPILYYGSSITQGACANLPVDAYESIISTWNDVDFINLGFSGNALAEKEMVDYLKNIPCSLFVCDYDHNAPNVEHLEKTHYALYENYRKANPNVPILFITRPDYDKSPEKNQKRLQCIKATYRKAKRMGDDKVYFLSGKTLYGKDLERCYADLVHPNSLGHYKMAKGIYSAMKRISTEFI